MTKIMLDSALSNLSGPLADFAQKLSGPEGNLKWLPAFKRFLREENPWDGTPLFAPWKKIHREANISSGFQVQSLRADGYTVTLEAHLLLTKAESGTVNRQEVEFVRVTPKDLGLEYGADHYLDVLRRLKFVGLMPCKPDEVAELRRHCDEQAFGPMSEGYFEALMEPVEINGSLMALELNHEEDDGRLKLTAFGVDDNAPGGNAPYVCVSSRRNVGTE